jgi:hypothetical protein
MVLLYVRSAIEPNCVLKGVVTMKYKIIENTMPEFEKELNEFASQKDIEVISLNYSTSRIVVDEHDGLKYENMHNVLIQYTDYSMRILEKIDISSND